MGNPKTLKLILPGEVQEDPIEFLMPDGSIVRFDKTRKVMVPSKKNQQEIKIFKKGVGENQVLTPVLLASAQHQKWHKEHLSVFKKWKSSIEDKGIRIPVVRAKIKILFYFPTSADRDLGNKAETIYDMLEDAGIIASDSFKVLKPIEIDGFVQKDKPRTEIYLTLIEPDSPEYSWDKTPESYYEAKRERKRDMDRTRSQIKRAEIKANKINQK